MADFPAGNDVSQQVINTWSLEAVGIPMLCEGRSMASAVWPTANLAIAVPAELHVGQTINQLMISNGAAVSGNVDAGLYLPDGTRIVSKGSTAQAGTSVIQALDVTDTYVAPGLIYMVQAMDNTTGTFQRPATPAVTAGAMGVLQMATAFPLPATMTFAAMAQVGVPNISAFFRTVV